MTPAVRTLTVAAALGLLLAMGCSASTQVAEPAASSELTGANEPTTVPNEPIDRSQPDPSGSAPTADSSRADSSRAAASPVRSATATGIPGSPTPGGASRACTVTSAEWKGQQRFWTEDESCWSSPWYAGSHRVMITFGCNGSPWYKPSSLCGGRHGFHHGVDIDMPVGTPVTAGVAGIVVLDPPTMGDAYGDRPVVVRSMGVDHVLGHLSEVRVTDGQQVNPGQLLGLSGMSGAEELDGPHLHFETRPAGETVDAATDPWTALQARRD